MLYYKEQKYFDNKKIKLNNVLKILKNPKAIIKKIFDTIRNILFVLFKTKNNKVFKIIISKAFNLLSKLKKNYSYEIYKHNSFYGNSYNLRKYSNFQEPIMASIEHGLYIGNHCIEFEIKNTIFPSIITLSKYREKIIFQKKCNKYIFTIGPYIHYASSFLNQKTQKKIKKKLGKNLLVFPVHSLENISNNYNTDEFINEIIKIKEYYKFDSVNICLYWTDFLKGLDKIYRKHNFNIVTAGKREDICFLARLRTLIELSDLTISNSTGTHLGYSIFLKKPHYIFDQTISTSATSKKDYYNEFKNRDFESSLKIQEILINNFNKLNFKINKQQKEICNYYWGFDQIKNRAELRNILEKINGYFSDDN